MDFCIFWQNFNGIFIFSSSSLCVRHYWRRVIKNWKRWNCVELDFALFDRGDFLENDFWLNFCQFIKNFVKNRIFRSKTLIFQKIQFLILDSNWFEWLYNQMRSSITVEIQVLGNSQYCYNVKSWILVKTRIPKNVNSQNLKDENS